MAAASIDVVIAISIFGVFFGLAFSEGKLFYVCAGKVGRAGSQG